MISLKYYILERKRSFILIGTVILLLAAVSVFLLLTKKTITVSDGSQEITVTVYGFATASDAVAKSGLALEPYDQLNMQLNTVLKQNDTVLVVYDALTPTQELIAEQQQQQLQESQAAQAEQAAQAAAAVQTVQPETATVSSGNTVQTSVGSLSYSDVINVVATAYDPSSCYPYAGTSTASGTAPEEFRTIAAWQGLPFGTKVYIPYFDSAPNHGIFIVEDRGGAITENKIDIFFDSNQKALQFGRRTLQVYILN